MKIFTSFISFKNLLILISLLFITNGIQAQYYWVEGNGDWNDFENHWATTSGGSTFHTNSPLENDDVFFDANSFANVGEGITLNGNAICRDMDWSSATNFPFLQSNDPDVLQVYGSFILNVDMTCNIDDVEFLSSSSGNEINTYGITLGNLSVMLFSGTGEWDLQSNITASVVYFDQGTFNSNGYDINLFSFFRTRTANDKTLNMANSILNVTSWFVTGANNNLNMGTSTLIARQFDPGNGNNDYYNVSLFQNCSVTNSAQINELDFTETTGWTCTLESGITLTCDNLIGLGTRLIPLNLKSSTEGQEATIVKTTGEINIEYVSMTDIHASGGATFNANNCIDNGNNDGWNITAISPLDFYWVNDGGDWSDADHWATTSGGSTLYDIFPTRYDNVFIDENSFASTNQTIAIDTTCMMRDITTEGVLFTPTIDNPFTEIINVFGNCFFSDGINKEIYILQIIGTEYDITFHPGALGTILNLRFFGGVHCTLMSDLTCGGHNINAEVYYNTNGYSIDCSGDFSVNHFPETTTEVVFGTSEITCRDFKVSNTDVLIDAEDVTITCQRDFKGQENEYGHVIMAEEGTIFNNNTFGILEFVPGSSYALEIDKIQTITSELLVAGTPTDPIEITSSEAGQQATFSKTSGTVSGSYLTLQDNNAIGGAVFNTDQSIDNGNNTGWNITAIEPHDYYWVGGSGNWSDVANHWATTSGGNSFYSFVPGVLDNVYFDANSFSANGQTIILDLETANFHDMDWSAISFETTFDTGSTNELNVYGSFILAENLNIICSHYNFLTSDVSVINTGNNNTLGLISQVNFDGTGSWDLQDSLSVYQMFFKGGTLNSNNFGINITDYLKFDTEATKIVNLGTSVINTGSTQWYSGSGSNLTLNAGESDWYVDRSFIPITNGDNNTYDFNQVTFVPSNDEGFISIGGESIDVLTISEGKTMRFVQFAEVTVGQFIAEGTLENPIVMYSNQVGSQATIVQSSGEVNGMYLDLQDMNATGGAIFYANNSINNGNNSGWIFTGVAQTIDFTSIDNVMEDSAPITLLVSASSGLDIIYTIIGGPATIDGNVLTITGAGLVEVQASQSGDLEYNPAPSIIQSFCAIPFQPTIIGSGTLVSYELESSADNGNTWYLDGELIEGEQNQQFTAFVSGLYTVIIDVNGCISEESETYVLTDVSVGEVEIQNLTIFPNPISNGETLFIGKNESNTYIRVIDLRGRIVVSKMVNSSIVIDSLNKGLYIVEIIQDNNSRFVRLVVE